jgi:hypothetical protein
MVQVDEHPSPVRSWIAGGPPGSGMGMVTGRGRGRAPVPLYP